MADPRVQKFALRRFHNLEASSARRMHPARVIGNLVCQHTSASLEAFADGRCVAMLEALDNHKKHEPDCIGARHFGRTSSVPLSSLPTDFR